MKLIIQNQTAYRLPRTSLHRLFLKTLQTLQKEKETGYIELTMVSEQQIRKYNKRHRGKDKVTDVLSFEYKHEKGLREDLIGEIIISPSRANRQKGLGKSLKHELNKLFVHGLLHIFGFNHISDEDFYTMNNLEKRILESQK